MTAFILLKNLASRPLTMLARPESFSHFRGAPERMTVFHPASPLVPRTAADGHEEPFK